MLVCVCVCACVVTCAKRETVGETCTSWIKYIYDGHFMIFLRGTETAAEFRCNKQKLIEIYSGESSTLDGNLLYQSRHHSYKLCKIVFIWRLEMGFAVYQRFSLSSYSEWLEMKRALDCIFQINSCASVRILFIGTITKVQIYIDARTKEFKKKNMKHSDWLFVELLCSVIYTERESHRIMTTAPVTVVAHFCCEAHETKIFSFRLINNPLRSTWYSSLIASMKYKPGQGLF